MAEIMQVPKNNSFVIVVTVLHAGIYRCLETLYKYTMAGTFYVFIVDQTIDGLDTNLRNKYKNLTIIRTPKSDIHHTGNLGHSGGTNLALRLVETPYVTLLNDDVEFVNKDWWQGVLDTFEQVEDASRPTYEDEDGEIQFKLDEYGNKLPGERPAIMVNPASIKLPDWSIGSNKGDDFFILPYKEEYTDQEYQNLINEKHYINERLTLVPGSVIDGVNLYCSVCDTKKLNEIGWLDEYFYTGSANDYDASCRAGMFGYRCVGTTLSWVFHHWSKTFHSDEEMRQLVQPELQHGDLREKWDEEKCRLDVWGVKCKRTPEPHEIRFHTTDGKIGVCPVHPDETIDIPQNTFLPL